MKDNIKKRLKELKGRYRKELKEYEQLKNKINGKEKTIISIKGAINEFEDILRKENEGDD